MCECHSLDKITTEKATILTAFSYSQPPFQSFPSGCEKFPPQGFLPYYFTALLKLHIRPS